VSIDLSTRYLGLDLRSPLVLAASPVVEDLEQLARCADAGAAAAVFPSLFQEQVEHETLEVQRLHESTSDAHAEALDYFPELDRYNLGAEGYLRRLEQARRAVDIPIIGSLNGCTPGGWIRYARAIEEAGASALELNIYSIPIDVDDDAAQVESRAIELVREVRAAVSIPLAVKLAPVYTSIPHVAHRLVSAGADGLVLFNRLLEPDIDLETLEVRPHLHLSRPEEAGAPRRWLAILRRRISASLAASGGCHGVGDCVKMLLVGADVVQLASSVLRNGPGHLATLTEGLRSWLAERGYASVGQLRGSLCLEHSPEPEAWRRASYMRALTSTTRGLAGPEPDGA